MYPFPSTVQGGEDRARTTKESDPGYAHPFTAHALHASWSPKVVRSTACGRTAGWIVAVR